MPPHFIMLETEQQDIIDRVLYMQRQGLHAVINTLLPELYVKVFGRMYRTNCPICHNTAFEDLIKWARKRNKNSDMASSKYKFKIEFEGEKLSFFYKGMKHFVDQYNLTDELAEMLLSIPKYAHVLEPLPVQKHVVTKDVLNPPVQYIAATDLEVSGEGKQSEASTVLTSTEQKTDGQVVKPRRGRPSRQ